MKKLPEKVDLREMINIPVMNQGELNSSAACAVSVVYRISAKKKAKWLYYKSRNL